MTGQQIFAGQQGVASAALPPRNDGTTILCRPAGGCFGGSAASQ